MNEKINELAYMLIGIFQTIIDDRKSQSGNLYKEPMWTEHPSIPYFMLGIKLLELNDPSNVAQHYYTITMRTKEIKIPIDILDFIESKHLFTIRFNGLELPLLDSLGVPFMDTDQFFRVISTCIECNEELMTSLKFVNRGPYATKQTRK